VFGSEVVFSGRSDPESPGASTFVVSAGPLDGNIEIAILSKLIGHSSEIPKPLNMIKLMHKQVMIKTTAQLMMIFLFEFDFIFTFYFYLRYD